MELTMQWLVEFKVSGKGMFPLDMLRYDQAWPMREQDSVAISTACRSFIEQHTVHLRKIAPSKRDACIAMQRWRSFGWNAELVDIARIR